MSFRHFLNISSRCVSSLELDSIKLSIRKHSFFNLICQSRVDLARSELRSSEIRLRIPE
jgi:hypothetical protein